MRRPHALIACFALTAALALASAAPAEAAWVWPVEGDVITPYRNGTDPYASGQHRGIDVAAAVDTPIVAAAGGDVRFAGTAGSSGLTISIRTRDGYDTSYLHLSTLAVRAGARVAAGERIGAVGTTGIRSATAPHLHFGVRDAGTDHSYHDPLTFLPAPPAAPAPHSPAPAPAPAPAPEPAPPAAAPLTPTPAARPKQVANQHRTPQQSPPAAADSTSSGRGHRAISSPHSAEATPAGAAASPSSGPDIGWALACGGLLLAAAILGLAGGPRRPPRSALARLRLPLPRG
jgi:hypothetical protein